MTIIVISIIYFLILFLIQIQLQFGFTKTLFLSNNWGDFLIFNDEPMLNWSVVWLIRVDWFNFNFTMSEMVIKEKGKKCITFNRWRWTTIWWAKWGKGVTMDCCDFLKYNHTMIIVVVIIKQWLIKNNNIIYKWISRVNHAAIFYHLSNIARDTRWSLLEY